jgi:hypothetical protein
MFISVIQEPDCTLLVLVWLAGSAGTTAPVTVGLLHIVNWTLPILRMMVI